MDRGYEKEQFTCVSIKISIAKKFRKFCKHHAKSQSMTLLDMVDFFEANEVSPSDRLGETISSLKQQMKRRFNAIIAIIRDIEKNQTKPTTAMLHKLFEEASNEVEEEFDFGTPTLISENEELIYYRDGYFKIQEQVNIINNDFENVLQKVKYVKGNFGGSYLKLEMTKNEFESLKQKLEHVRNDNSTKIGR